MTTTRKETKTGKPTLFNISSKGGDTQAKLKTLIQESNFLKVTLNESNRGFVPLGIENKGIENGKFHFELEILKDGFEYPVLYIFLNDECVQKAYIRGEVEQGVYEFKWDGFDLSNNQKIYSSKKFHNAELRAKFEAQLNGISHVAYTKIYKLQYDRVKWVDIEIDRINSKIKVNLRVNLKDGGAKLIDLSNIVPTSKPTLSEPIILKRKSYKYLKKLTKDGIEKYWSRHKNNIGKNITIGLEYYEVFVKAKSTSVNSMNDIPLRYNTNCKPGRSGNPGGVYPDYEALDNILDTLDKKIVDSTPNLLYDYRIQQITYNEGWLLYSNGWFYEQTMPADEDFEVTAAHEVGHEIVQAYGGTIYSYQHKGSSYLFPQDTVPTNRTLYDDLSHLNPLDVKGEDYPAKGEIDLMKYYNVWYDKKLNKIAKDHSRTVASEYDVLMLIWLTKLSINPL